MQHPAELDRSVTDPGRLPGERVVLNAFTVDVEEHFQVSAFEATVARDQWESIPSRVEANTNRVLDLLEEHRVCATFFVLGWVAERHPRLVRAIASRGHEVACHGYSHRLVYSQSASEFSHETALARKILQDASDQEVVGYRAASFSITRKCQWALDVLVECGFAYDSSVFPILHDRYGIPGACRRIHELETPLGSKLVEVPPSTVVLVRRTIPVAGGGYLRIYPESLTRWAIRRLNRREQMPTIVYVHPWELDTKQPRVPAPLMSRFRHYTGLQTTSGKLRRLLDDFHFGPVREVISRRHSLGEGGGNAHSREGTAHRVSRS